MWTGPSLVHSGTGHYKPDEGMVAGVLKTTSLQVKLMTREPVRKEPNCKMWLWRPGGFLEFWARPTDRFYAPMKWSRTLSKCWKALEATWPRPKDVNVRLHELVVLMCLWPLLQTDLSATYDGSVTCSDAYETGGAAAVSCGLSWSGKSLAASKADARGGPVVLPNW